MAQVPVFLTAPGNALVESGIQDLYNALDKINRGFLLADAVINNTNPVNKELLVGGTVFNVKAEGNNPGDAYFGNLAAVRNLLCGEASGQFWGQAKNFVSAIYQGSF